jgi:uncharacterized SAM-binding protein YcdF (DUF218 family)
MGFILSKVFWAFFAPGNMLVLLLLLGAFLLTARKKGWQDFGRKLCFDIAFLLFFIAVFPVGDWLLTPIENRFPPAKPDHVDGIVLLGGDEKPYLTEQRGQPVAYSSMRRYVEFAALAREYPQAKLIFTGGSGLMQPESKIKDADIAKETLASIGVPVDRMTFEDASRNTHENAVKTAELIHPTAQQKYLLVTSAWHMPRSMACFRKAGWNVYPAPTDYMTGGGMSSRLQFNLAEHLVKIDLAVHEYYGLLAYRAMGYIDTLWPK